MTRCSATTASGRACRSPALSGATKCYFHEQAVRPARLAASARGGARRVLDLGARTLSRRQARRLLVGLLERLLAGKLAPERLLAACRAIGIEHRLAEDQELVELTKRIERLEQLPRARGG